MQRSCDLCGQLYERPPSLIGKYCSHDCAKVARRKPTTNYRRIRHASDHPLASASGYVSEARAVLFEQIGPGNHSCYWCGSEVEWMIGARGNSRGALIADHRDNNPLNDNPDNLVPSCGSCNGTRWHTVAEDEPHIIRRNGTRLRIKYANCISCGRRFNATYKRKCSTCWKHGC